MSILGLLNQEIAIVTRSGYGHDGRPTFATSTTIRARFEAKPKRILKPDGTVLTLDAFAVVKSDATVEIDDKVTYDSKSYIVVDIFEVPGGNGVIHHKELRLQICQ